MIKYDKVFNKTYNKNSQQIEGNFLSLIKDIYRKLVANSRFDNEK